MRSRLCGTLALLFLLAVAGCHSAQRRGSPGVNCTRASCCHGWYWTGTSCEPLLGPENCGCSCQVAPEPYSSELDCHMDHPAIRGFVFGTPAGALQRQTAQERPPPAR